MASGGFLRGGKVEAARPFALLGLALTSASCVPGVAADLPVSFTAIAMPADSPAGTAPAASVSIPASPARNASGYVFRGRTSIDRLRALDCLAQAIYYEARSESEDGQRAVAQVVVNRIRHPAWPNSVCGVVYQGPLRAGGGCQFTFTCDGSLAVRPQGPGWARARAIAAETLSGRTYAPAGFATHYHTNAVAPSWAPRLALTTVIGAHIFYRLPGAGGLPSAFRDAYAGREPVPHPTQIFFRTALLTPSPDFAALTPATPAAVRATATLPSDIPQQQRWTAANLPESTVREEYRQSGQWRADAPTAITGAR
jgi:hypothetical protein